MLVFVNAMIPNEVVGDWGTATGSSQARIARAREHGYSEQFDDDVYFFHDVARDVGPERDQTEHIFEDVCRFDAWP